MLNAAANRAGEASPIGLDMAPAARLPQLPALTSLRFFAALLVMLHHVMRHLRPGIIPTDSANPLGAASERIVYALLYEGNLAVPFFFVLSGFVLAYSYLNRDGAFRASMPRFYLARFARIYPAYLFALVVAAAPFLWQNSYLPRHELRTILLLDLTMSQSWTRYATIWNDPAWSLSVEAGFYAAFPLLAIVIGRLRRTYLPYAFALCFAILILLPLLCLTIAHVGLLSQENALGMIYDWPIMRLPEFVLGMVVGRAFVLDSRMRVVCRVVSPGVALALCALGLLAVYACIPLGYIPGLLAPLWALLLVVCSGATSRPLARLLAWGPIVLLGEASYSLYLLHWPLWDWYTALLGLPRVRGATPESWLLVASYIVLVCSVSLLSYRTIERPMRRHILRLAGN